jgi:transposase
LVIGAETLPFDQLELGLEDVQRVQADTAAASEAIHPDRRAATTAKRRANPGGLPEHLPRIETLFDIEDKTCPCCAGALHAIGEDRAEQLDIVPAQLRVLVTRRPSTPAGPARMSSSRPWPGRPTKAMVAHMVTADPLPLYCQAQIYGRRGIQLDRSTLADWGRAAFLLRSVHAHLLEMPKRSDKLFADETTAPVLDLRRGGPRPVSFEPTLATIARGADMIRRP